MMWLWRIVYGFRHGLAARIRIELNAGQFSYPLGTLPPYQRDGVERLLLDAKVKRAIITIKRDGRIAIMGVNDSILTQRIRNVLKS